MSIEQFKYSRIPPEAEALRSEVRAFLAETLQDYPAVRRADSWMGFDADFSRRLAAEGWVGMALPKRYGGGDASPFARYVVCEELLAAGAPVSAHWFAIARVVRRYCATAPKPKERGTCLRSAAVSSSSVSG